MLCMCAQSYPILCDPMDFSLPGSLSMEFSRQEYCSRWHHDWILPNIQKTLSPILIFFQKKKRGRHNSKLILWDQQYTLILKARQGHQWISETIIPDEYRCKNFQQNMFNEASERSEYETVFKKLWKKF